MIRMSSSMMNYDVSFVGGGAMSTPVQPIQNGRNSIAAMREHDKAMRAAHKQRLADAEAKRVEEARIAEESAAAAVTAAAEAAAAADAAELAELTEGFTSWEDQADAEALAEPPTVVRQLNFAEVDATAPVAAAPEPAVAVQEPVVAAPVECPFQGNCHKEGCTNIHPAGYVPGPAECMWGWNCDKFKASQTNGAPCACPRRGHDRAPLPMNKFQRVERKVRYVPPAPVVQQLAPVVQQLAPPFGFAPLLMPPGLVLQYLNGYAPQMPYGNALMMVPGPVPPFFFGFSPHAPLGFVLQMIRGPNPVQPVAQPVQHAVLEQELIARAAEEAAARHAAEEEAAARHAAEAAARREAKSRVSAPDEEGFQTVRAKPVQRAAPVQRDAPVHQVESAQKACRWTLAEYVEGKSVHCFNAECQDKHPEGYIPGPQKRCRKAERCQAKCNHAHPGDRFWAHVPW